MVAVLFRTYFSICSFIGGIAPGAFPDMRGQRLGNSFSRSLLVESHQLFLGRNVRPLIKKLIQRDANDYEKQRVSISGGG